MEAYMDHAATTKICPAAKEKMIEALDVNYGNPSSRHRKGVEAEKYLRNTTAILAKEWKVQEKEIILTSGGTESNNLALIGAAMANKRAGMHIISTRFEHASVYQPLEFLATQGFRISYINVDSLGHVCMDELLSEICEETILVSVMYVNNEVGAVQDIAAIAKAIKEKKADILLHVDAIQAFGKYRIHPRREGIDLMSVSGHKIHGPKGSGALFVRDKVKVKPLLYGGGQQRDMRSGTENVPAIAGLGAATEWMYQSFDRNLLHLRECKAALIQRMLQLEGVNVNAVFNEEETAYIKAQRAHILAEDVNEEDKHVIRTAVERTAPHVLSVSFDGVRSEVLLHALEDRGVYVSSGSACSSNHPALSGTLQAIGVAKDLLDSTLRFSFSVETSREEIEYAAEMTAQLLPQLRRTLKRC